MEKDCDLEDNGELVACDLHNEGCLAILCHDCGTLFRDCEDSYIY